MSDLIRRCLAVPLLALHIAIALCGPGHHAPLAESGGHAEASCGSVGPGDLSVAVAETEACPVDDDCPLCDYLSQAASPSVAHPDFTPGEKVEIASPRHRLPLHAAPLFGPSIPRGPPVAGMI